MANEAVILELGLNGGKPIRFTCDDAYGITKGALLRLQTPYKVSGANLTNNIPGTKFAGIAAMEKVASDSSTQISCYTDGEFGLTASGIITAGELVIMSGANLISSAHTLDHILSGCIVGKALQTAADTNVIRVKLGSPI